MEAGIVSKTRQHSSRQGLKPREEIPNQKLPCELLLILFSYVHIPDDLVSVQRVCCGWRAAAQDKSLWKNFTLTLYGTPQDKRKVIIMPAVRNIDGEANNEVIIQILENVNELSKLNVNFDPPLTLLHIQAVLEKYPYLESISLGISAPDILESLEVLKISEHLTEVIFYVPRSRRNECYFDHVWLHVFDIFTDRKNFTALRKTNLVDPLYCLNKEIIMPAISSFMTEKSEQLLSLKMKKFPQLDMRNTVSKCTKLQELDLTLYMGNSSDIFIQKMTELKSLSLRFRGLNDRDDFSIIQDYFYKGSWAYLSKVCFLGHIHKIEMVGGVLNAIISNVKQLEDLNYYDRERNTTERELCEVGNLPKLVNLTVHGLHSITNVGMSYISNCSKLKTFKLVACISFCDLTKDVHNTLCKNVNLEKFYIAVFNGKPFTHRGYRFPVNLIRLNNKEEIKRFTSS